MAEINVNNGGGKQKNKPQKATLRVDFTPMVDMNMLLICFFMFCTTLSISQVMDIAMPADSDGKETKSPESKSLTLILDQDEVYYYHGFPNYEDYTSLKTASYAELRSIILEKNSALAGRARQLKQQLAKKEISEKNYKDGMENIKKSKDGAVVMIKPLATSSYRNLVEALDEMQICSVGQYTIMEVAKEDNFLLDNLKSKGELTAMIDKK